MNPSFVSIRKENDEKLMIFGVFIDTVTVLNLNLRIWGLLELNSEHFKWVPVVSLNRYQLVFGEFFLIFEVYSCILVY